MADSPEQVPKVLKKEISALIMQSIATRGLFILAILYTLFFAQQLLVPLAFAFWFYFLLKPSVIFLFRKWHIPKPLGSAIVLFSGFVLVAFAIFYFSAQAEGWMQNAPQTFDAFVVKLSSLTEFLKTPTDLIMQLVHHIRDSFNIPTQQASQVSWIGLLFASTWAFLVETSIFFIFLYFLLASERSFLTNIITILLPEEHKSDAMSVVQQIEGKIWGYIFARTVINVVLAVVLSIIFFIFEVPNAILLGVVIGFLEYIPYLGALIAIFLVTVISVVSFDSAWYMLSVPMLSAIIIYIEGNIITPIVLGKTLVLAPVEVVLSIIIFGWIWGASGAFLAIPLTLSLKVILDNINEENFMKTLSE